MVTEILRPATVQEALRAASLPGASFLGGGTWLNVARAGESVILISLEKLGLGSIQTNGKRCIIGATATFQQMVDNQGVPEALRSAARLIASRTLRNMVTMGGEVALHPSDSALVPLLMVMQAEVLVAGKRKPVPIQTYLLGRETGLILSISIPEPLRLARVFTVSRTSHSPRSLVVAASAEAVTPAVSGLRIIASDCRSAPVRISSLETLLEGRPLPSRSEIEQATWNEFSPGADIHASSSYKAYMARILVADVLLVMAEGKAKP